MLSGGQEDIPVFLVYIIKCLKQKNKVKNKENSIDNRLKEQYINFKQTKCFENRGGNFDESIGKIWSGVWWVSDD